jgi:soluble lytic murein transglycosylase-like protein
MQLMPATATRFGVSNRYDPLQNVRGGALYLGFLIKRFRQNVHLALAASDYLGCAAANLAEVTFESIAAP